MTAAQVRYILETVLGLDSTADALALSSVILISDTKKENLITDPTSKRFRFDLNKDLMERWNCYKYSSDVNKVPAHGHYDIIYSNEAKTAGVVYAYVVDADDGNRVQKDYYDIGNIICISADKDIV